MPEMGFLDGAGDRTAWLADEQARQRARRQAFGPGVSSKTWYLIRFDRIGRGNNGVLLDTYAEDAGDLAATIFHFAKPLLVSKMFDVTVDLEQGKGWIEGGRFGTFTIEEKKA